MDPSAAILALLEERRAGLTICPSEAARRVAPGGWASAMPEVHGAARRLAADGRVVLMQRGAVVSPEGIVGAYRIRKA